MAQPFPFTPFHGCKFWGVRSIRRDLEWWYIGWSYSGYEIFYRIRITWRDTINHFTLNKNKIWKHYDLFSNTSSGINELKQIWLSAVIHHLWHEFVKLCRSKLYDREYRQNVSSFVSESLLFTKRGLCMYHFTISVLNSS